MLSSPLHPTIAGGAHVLAIRLGANVALAAAIRVGTATVGQVRILFLAR
jgi:hypothetical protein